MYIHVYRTPTLSTVLPTAGGCPEAHQVHISTTGKETTALSSPSCTTPLTPISLEQPNEPSLGRDAFYVCFLNVCTCVNV